MIKGIIGKKVGMTQIFDENGNAIPVTVIEAGPCTVVQKKTAEGKDGYDAVQLGFEDIAERKLTKAEAGHFKKNGLTAKRYLKEFRLEDVSGLNVGDTVAASVFAAGEKLCMSLARFADIRPILVVHPPFAVLMINKF